MWSCATLRPVLAPLSVPHEAFYLMWDNMTTVKASVKRKTKSWQPGLLSRGDMSWSKERLGTYEPARGQRESTNSATRHSAQPPRWSVKSEIHKLREKTKTTKCNSSTIKWRYLQFKLHQQLIQICDLPRLDIQNKCNRLKVWNNRRQKHSTPKYFPSPSLAPAAPPQYITEWNAACNYPLSNQLESTLNHVHSFGLGQLSIRALSGLSTAERRCIISRLRIQAKKPQTEEGWRRAGLLSVAGRLNRGLLSGYVCMAWGHYNA